VKKHSLSPCTFDSLEFGFVLDGIGKEVGIGRTTGRKPGRYRNGTTGGVFAASVLFFFAGV
jgi:hypothetical protein